MRIFLTARVRPRPERIIVKMHAACSLLAFLLMGLEGSILPQQVTSQDLDKILERADRLLEEAKTAYEGARAKGSLSAFVEAGFKLEEARIKYIVLQEIGAADKQKIASDRLRAVNQLSKLINDGRKAATGASGGSSEEKAIDPGVPPPPRDPAVSPPATPAKEAPDVSKRSPVPDAGKIKEAEKVVKDLFRDQYAKKSPADRKALARTLLDQAAASQDDLAGLWVLYRESQDLAAGVCDVRTAIEAAEAAARMFDVDGMTIKNATLAAAGKIAKSPEESGAVAHALLALTDDLIAADQYDAADRATTAAIQHARKSQNSSLLARATTRGKEASEAKTAFQSMKAVLETLAKSPDDPSANLEMGRFLCFVKGNWDLGTRFLAKGSDPAYKTLSEKELAFPADVQERVALADGWYDLAEKEKSPLRKTQLQAHSRLIYESALAQATGLMRAKIAKRLDELDSRGPGGGALDLLKLVSPKDSVGAEWVLSGSTLISPNGKACRIQIPYAPGESEYDLTVVVQPKEGSGNFEIGLAYGKAQFMVDLDGSPTADLSGLHLLDGKGAVENETTHKGKVLIGRPTCTIVCAVRRTGVTVTVDGRKIIDFKGDYARLTMDSFFVVPNPQALFLGAWRSQCVVTKLTLTKVSGQGKLLR